MISKQIVRLATNSVTEPHEAVSETTLSAGPDIFDPDATLPYETEPEDDVYRVGWTGDIDVELSCESEEEVDVHRELWTHVYRADRPPAPYTESVISEVEVNPVPEHVTRPKVGLCQRQLFS